MEKTETTPNDQAKPESPRAELEEENNLLLLQLHQVQEELERYYLRNQELEKASRSSSASSSSSAVWVDDELPEALAEIQRLKSLVDTQQKIHRLESQNALSARLGKLLIQNFDAGSLFTLPGKLGKIWRESSRKTPPEILGGKFEKLIAAYDSGDFASVEKLLLAAKISPAMQANAYTALARHLMHGNSAKAAEAARRAHALDPKAFRQKWLAFRLHDAGQLIEAESLLDALPPESSFSESEARLASQMRYEAKQARRREAKKKSGFSERRAEAERQLKRLTEERDAQARRASERERELKSLKEAETQTEAQQREVERLEREKSALLEQSKAHEQEIERLETERSRLEALQEEQSRLNAEQDLEIAALKQATSLLETEKASLVERHKEREREKVLLEREKTKLLKNDINDFLRDLDLFFNGRTIIYADVGAYVGDVFLEIKNLAKQFRIHEAHLFEPNPKSYVQLFDKLKDVSRVHTYNLAVGEAQDAIQFIPAGGMTHALPAETRVASGFSDIFTAPCVSLDSQSSFFTDGKINLLKIDVGGREMDVLASANQLLAAQNIDILYIEVGFNRSGKQQTYFADIDQYLQPLGYRVLRIYEQKNEWMSGSPMLRRANIAYMSEKFANAHPLKLMQELQKLRNQLEDLKGKRNGHSQ